MKVQIRPRGPSSVKLKFIPGIQGPPGDITPEFIALAGQISTDAGTASAAAGTATTKAGEASGSAAAAAGSAGTATTQAGFAATKASEAEGFAAAAASAPPFNVSLAPFTQTGTGAVPETVEALLQRMVMPEQFIEAGDDNDIALACNRAFSAGHKALLMPAYKGYSVKSKISVPALGRIVSLGGSVLTKAANCDMVELGDGAQLHGLELQGAGATYSGRGVIIATGNDQRILNCNIKDTQGYCLEFTTINQGIRFLAEGGSWIRTTPSAEAIKLPGVAPYTTFGTNADSATIGERNFKNIFCGGGKLIDLSGGNITVIEGCNTTGITFQDGSRYCKINNTRCSGDLNIKGFGHNVYGDTLGGNVTLMSGVTDTTVFCGQMSGTFTDNSGSTNNLVFGQVSTFTPVINWPGHNLGSGSALGRLVRNGRSVTVYIALNFGTGFVQGTGSLLVSLPAPFSALLNSVETIGPAWIFENGVGYHHGMAICAGGAPQFYFNSNGSGSSWGSGSPIVFEANDRIVFSVTYTM